MQYGARTKLPNNDGNGTQNGAQGNPESKLYESEIGSRSHLFLMYEGLALPIMPGSYPLMP